MKCFSIEIKDDSLYSWVKNASCFFLVLYLLIGTTISTTSLLGMLLPYFKFIDGDIEREEVPLLEGK